MDIWATAWAGSGHTKTAGQKFVVTIMMARSYPSLKDIGQFLALSQDKGTQWGRERSTFYKIGMFCDRLECLITAYNERTLLNSSNANEAEPSVRQEKTVPCLVSNKTHLKLSR